MKNYEKKSFFTTFFLFFLPLFFLSSVVLYMYHNEQIKELEKDILYKMKDYSYDFEGDVFSLDIVDDDKTKVIFQIYHEDEGLCAYFQVPSNGPYLLKIIYNKTKYEKFYTSFLHKIYLLSFIIFILIFFISLSFAFYSLKPMKEALYLLENFLKDLIHDLNTPATSILLNSKLLRKRGDFEEIERIELCAKGIASLYKNLELISPVNMKNDEIVQLDIVIKQKIEILEKIYPHIIFNNNMNTVKIKSNVNAIERIIDNLMTNACKYNKKNGIVNISMVNNKLIIEDSGIGIKDTKKVFQRYYKETDSGLGIGLSIVQKLCETLDITIEITSKIGKGSCVELSFR